MISIYESFFEPKKYYEKDGKIYAFATDKHPEFEVTPELSQKYYNQNPDEARKVVGKYLLLPTAVAGIGAGVSANLWDHHDMPIAGLGTAAASGLGAGLLAVRGSIKSTNRVIEARHRGEI